MNILFVCTGNTCRSVIAEYLLRKMASENDKITVQSCGTAASANYRVPEIVKTLLAEEGLNPSAHVSTQINRRRVKNADVIFVMEKAHRDYILEMFGGVQKVELLGGNEEIPDPIGQPDEVYAATFEIIKNNLRRLLLKGLINDEK